MFGNKPDDYEYTSLVKYPDHGCPYVKVCLAVSYPDKSILTEVSLSDKPVDVHDADEFANVVRYKSYVKIHC